MRIRLALVCAYAVCATMATAQTDRGSIRGTITDPSSAVLVGATVTATNPATGISFTAKTTTAGTYNIAALPSGTYRVEVGQPGFTTIRTNVVVDVGNVVGLDLRLEVGSSTQTVSVEAAAPILKTEQSSSSAEVAVDAFGELPLSAGGGRSPQNFKYLTPGVNNNNSINGAPQASAQVSMDGITVQNAEQFGADNDVRFPPEAVAEMSIVTTAYAAEYGQTGGGVQRYAIKSGTNQYHGNLYEYLKNTAFDARGFFNLQTPIDRQHEFGFSLGGPVSIPKVYNGSNRSFFFFNADWFKTRGGSATNIVSLPNSAFRTGDFSGNLGAAVAGASNACTGGNVVSGQIYDPLSTTTINGQQCRVPFSGNAIPANRISPAARKILGLLPQTNTEAVLNNAFLPSQPSFNNFNDYTIKGDQYLGSKHHLSVLFVNSSNPSGGGSLLPPPITTAGDTIWSWNMARLTHDWVVKPNLLNELRLGYNRQIFTHAPTGSYDQPGWAADFGIPGFSSASGLFPGILWGSYRTLGNQQFWYATSNTYVVSDSVTWTRGRHNLKFGFEYDDMWHALWKDWPAQISFSRNETGLPTALGSTGNEVASFLLGAVDSSNIPSLANTSVNYQVPRTVDAYAQDDYKITPRITINYGLRWSLYMPMRERNNIYSAVDLGKPNPSAGNLPGAYVFAGRDGQGECLSSACEKSSGLAPRLGIAWKLSERLVVRSGYGISYFPTGLYGAGNNAYLTDGFNPTSTSTTPDAGITPAFTFAQGFPAAQLQTKNLTSSYAIGSTFDYWSRYAQTVANIQSWNVTLQTQLAPNLAWDVGYVGTKGTHLSAAENINQLDPRYLSVPRTLLNSNINSPDVVAAGYRPPWAGFSSALGANATLAQSLRPFPQYLTGFGYNSDNNGNSLYHSLQTKLEKRMSKGLYLLVSYTWAKATSDANNTLLSTPGNNPSGAGRARDQYNRHLDKAVSSTWQPHVLSTAFDYQLPLGPGKKFLSGGGAMARAVGGWHLSGILTYRKGSLVSVSAPQNLPLFAGPNYASTVAGVAQKASWTGNFDPATDRYLNVAAFTLPATGTFGTGGQYLPNVFGFFYMNENLSLAKNTRIKERLALDLRLETFNTFNRVVFGNGGTDISNPSAFGRVTSMANSPRNAQIAIKLVF